MKKVLVLSGSPRKGGNSDTLCDQFIRGAEESGHIATKIYLRDCKIGSCNCLLCLQKERCLR